MGGGDRKADAQITENRGYIYGQGGELSENASQNEAAYRELVARRINQADAAYEPALSGGGGYTNEQANAIRDKEGLEGLRTDDAALQSNYLTDQEQQGIRGDQSGVRAGLDQVNGAVDPASVADYTNRVRLTPEMQQLMAISSARDSAVQSQAAISANREAAMGAGMDPLGIASYSDRANQRAQIASANAATAGRVQANEIGADREGKILTATQNLQQQRERAAGTNLNAQQTMEANASTRNAGIAQNRQTTNVGNQNTKYTQGQYIEGQGAAREAGIADTQRADQKEGRDYLVGQIGGNTAAALTEEGIAAGLYGTTSGAANQSTSTQVEANKKPGWFDKLLSAGTSVGAAYAGRK